ncbi:Os1348 family NHLP clan protein [Micromonospora sp. LOL_023]|uniref:Os1348 family NHLP clan protein n=1 Tax=Micromonospora sp. LOL_023 TaxID=3345418 RepID=UPI003A8964DC
MSDFDTVLERLLTDPAFASALASDPGAALAGYQLTADEVALLGTQLGGGEDATGTAAVETRANQSSAFGLFSPLGGMLDGIGDLGAVSGFGPAGADSSGFGAADADSSGFGAADTGSSGFGPAGAMPVDPGSGGSVLGGYGAQIGDLLQPGDAAAPPSEPAAGFGPAGPPAEPAVPEGYQTRVDVDGDGEWDQHIVRGRADGGVDILVDHDGDGRVDFVGRDDDADGLVESAAYDTDGDGFSEQVHYDDDGDGWLDRSVTHEPPAGGGAIGGNL